MTSLTFPTLSHNVGRSLIFAVLGQERYLFRWEECVGEIRMFPVVRVDIEFKVGKASNYIHISVQIKILKQLIVKCY